MTSQAYNVFEFFRCRIKKNFFFPMIDLLSVEKASVRRGEGIEQQTGNSTCSKYKVKNEKIGLEGARGDVGRPLRRPVASAIVQERNDKMMGPRTQGPFTE